MYQAIKTESEDITIEDNMENILEEVKIEPEGEQDHKRESNREHDDKRVPEREQDEEQGCNIPQDATYTIFFNTYLFVLLS